MQEDILLGLTVALPVVFFGVSEYFLIKQIRQRRDGDERTVGKVLHIIAVIMTLALLITLNVFAEPEVIVLWFLGLSIFNYILLYLNKKNGFVNKIFSWGRLIKGLALLIFSLSTILFVLMIITKLF